jgi:hypothetical protein
MQEQAQRQMPLYDCHKQVWALKIALIETSDNGALITPVEEGYAPFEVDKNYLQKHSPDVGGYYVVYKDGYKAYSPEKAFEEGYTSTDTKIVR